MAPVQTYMQGKVCLITGANSGTGKVTALGLAHMGATVVMVCRDRVRGEEAQREIQLKSGNDDVDLLLLHFISSRFGSPEQGAKTTLYLASSPEVETITGKYFVKSFPRRSSARSYDESLQRQVWEESEKLVQLPAQIQVSQKKGCIVS